MASLERPAEPPVGPELLSEDAQLVAAVLRKDRKATAEFVSRFADPLYRYVRSRLAPRTDLVEDLVQEVFLAAWQHLDGFRAASSLHGWLMGIARHKVEDYYRGVLRQADPLTDTDEETIPDTEDFGIEDRLDRQIGRAHV